MPTLVIDNFQRESEVFTETDGRQNVHAIIDSPTFLTKNYGKFSDNPPTWLPPFSILPWNRTNIIDANVIYPSISWTYFIDGVVHLGGYGGAYMFHSTFTDQRGNLLSISFESGQRAKSGPGISSSDNIKLGFFNNKLILTSDAIVDGFYYIDADLNSSWTKITLPAGSYASESAVLNGNLYIAAFDITTIPIGVRIYRFDRNFNQVGYLTIKPQGGYHDKVLRLVPINNQYLGIITGGTWETNTLYLWDGDINSTTILQVKIPGRVVDAVNFNGQLYIAVGRRRGWSLMVLSGNSLIPVLNFEKLNFAFFNSRRDFCFRKIAVFENFLIILLDGRILFFDPINNYLFGYGWGPNQGILPMANTCILARNRRYYSEESESLMIHYPTSTSGTIGVLKVGYDNYIDISFQNNWNYYYRSNWFVLGKRIKINSAKIYYENPTTPSGTLTIKFNYIDEKRNGEVMQKSYDFDETTSPLPKSYLELNPAIEATKFCIEIFNSGTINSFNKVRIIKRVIIDYDILE